MSAFRIVILFAMASFLVACQTGQGGFAARKCEEAGHAKDSPAFKQCVDQAYAVERARANRYRSGGP